MSFNNPTDAPLANEVNLAHLNSDVDKSTLSQHHTLGILATQASPGDHTHNGVDSPQISFNDLTDAWMNVDGGTAVSIFGGLPTFDGGSA